MSSKGCTVLIILLLPEVLQHYKYAFFIYAQSISPIYCSTNIIIIIKIVLARSSWHNGPPAYPLGLILQPIQNSQSINYRTACLPFSSGGMALYIVIYPIDNNSECSLLLLMLIHFSCFLGPTFWNGNSIRIRISRRVSLCAKYFLPPAAPLPTSSIAGSTSRDLPKLLFCKNGNMT